MNAQKCMYIEAINPFVNKPCMVGNTSLIDANFQTRSRYFDALYKEVLSSSGEYDDYHVTSVVFSGGPVQSVVTSRYFEAAAKIQRAFHVSKDVPIIIQCDPWDLDPTICGFIRRLGNVLPVIRMYSCIREENHAIGRYYPHHGMDEAMRQLLYESVKNAGVVLCNNLPGQTEESLLISVKQCIESGVVHLSVLGSPAIPESVAALLEQSGYTQYSVGHFCRPGWELSCYTEQPYLGFGLGAVSKIDGFETKNTCDLEKYCAYSDNAEMIIEKVREIDNEGVD